VLTTDAWEQTRVRIAQLLPVDRFTSLVEYYTGVQYLNMLLDVLDEYTPPREKKACLPRYGGGLLEKGEEVRAWMRDEYIGHMKTPP
jgi:hypothetical protein